MAARVILPVIAPATVQDIPALCSLLQDLFLLEREFFPDGDKQRKALEMILATAETGFILVARDELEQPLGMVTVLFTISTFMGGRVGILEDLVVRHSHRGQGLGAALVAAALSKAKSCGCLRISLLTDSDNQVALDLYQRQGFTPSKMQVLRQLIDC